MSTESVDLDALERSVRDPLKARPDAATILALISRLRKLEAVAQAARDGLLKIYEEPNRYGPVADEIREEYGIDAWDIAAETLHALEALDREEREDG